MIDVLIMEGCMTDVSTVGVGLCTCEFCEKDILSTDLRLLDGEFLVCVKCMQKDHKKEAELDEQEFADQEHF